MHGSLCREVVFLVAVIGSSANLAQAGASSFTGTFTADDDMWSQTFPLASPATVTLTTFAYAGGTNAAGDMIAAGGFDPILSLI